jgi:hypothetical protein
VAEQLDGIAFGLVGAGAGLLYAGVKGKSIPALIQGFVQGKSPAAAATVPGEDDTTTTAASGASSYPTNTALEKLWTDNGGPADTAVIAAQIAMAESGGNAKATSSNPGGPACTNVGIWQLATPCGVGGGHSVAELENPNTNAQLTILATSGGTDWSQWSDPVANALPGHQYTPQPSD